MNYRLGAMAAVGLLLVWAAPGLAQAGAAKATFKVQVIEASKGAVPRIDPRLVGLERELKAFQPRYNRFSLVRDQSMVLTVNATGTVALAGKESFVIQFLGLQGKRIRYQAQLARTKTTRSVAPGGRAVDVLPRGGTALIVATIAHL